MIFMKILTDLKGTAVDGVEAQNGSLQALHSEPSPGVFRSYSLGPGGLVIKHQGFGVFISLVELDKLAEGAEPGLRPVQIEARKSGENSKREVRSTKQISRIEKAKNGEKPVNPKARGLDDGGEK